MQQPGPTASMLACVCSTDDDHDALLEHLWIDVDRRLPDFVIIWEMIDADIWEYEKSSG